MTPLMVASIRGGGIDNGEDIDTTDDTTAQIISELVAQGAELNATMDKTGETSLHLAARYARADAAKRLLDAGADANSQDNTGRTPLHAAVAADAMGVFQILLRNRATNLNARMHDGTTPLILAARLAIEGMVEDLINADSDINSADNSGKTALHWAAAVNNVEAVNILLLHGANRDAQDDKDETPLFLAAREGSFEACKALLDNFANREITDHMDRLPRDVAAERLHHDIIRLLDDHVPRSPQQLVTVIPNAIISSPSSHQLISQPTVIPTCKQTKQKKNRQKIEAANPTSPESIGGENFVKQRKPSVKKQSKKQNIEATNNVIERTMMTERSSSTNTNKNINNNKIEQTAVLQENQLQEIEDLLSSVESPVGNIPSNSPYDTTSIYSNAMAAFDMDFLNTNNNNNNNNNNNINKKKQPPSYEEVIKVSTLIEKYFAATNEILSF
jgi:Notch-like protein